jgi:hypothetical protein
LRIGGVVTLLCLGAVVWFAARRKRRTVQSV